jgi:uncharacterized protein
MRTRIEGRFAEGIRLFNEGRFFQAHELWEEDWKTAEGDLRNFYQGIIQAAAALVHVQRRNYRGAMSVYLKSRPKLEQFPPVWMGIELGQFRAQLALYFDALRPFFDSLGEDGLPPGARPLVGAGQFPTIKWTLTESSEA